VVNGPSTAWATHRAFDAPVIRGHDDAIEHSGLGGVFVNMLNHRLAADIG